MNKKQIKTLSVLAAVVVLLSAALIVLSHEENADTLPTLVGISAKDVSELAYSSYVADVAFVRNGKTWKLKSDPNFPVNSELVDTLVDTLCSVRPDTRMEEVDREAYGLTAPQCVIEVTTNKGSVTVLIGSMNAVTDQLYVQIGEEVYLTDTTLLQAFSGSALDLAQQFEIPKPENQLRVRVENANSVVFLSCDGDETGGKDGTWYVQLDGSWVEADQNMAYNFYFLTWDMHWKSTAGYVTAEDQLQTYGLAIPQARYTLTYGSSTFDMIFGANLPDGTTYVMCAGDNLVYTMDTLLVDWLNQATPESVLPASE